MNTTLENATDGRTVGPEPRPAVTAELLRLEDVCVLLRTTKRSVYRLCDAGKMPFGLKLNGMRRWRRAELMDWLAAGCPPVRSAKGAVR
ncbi:MAG: helix-turn-helix domain-containing protein [Planctomycetota bacterium]